VRTSLGPKGMDKMVGISEMAHRDEVERWTDQPLCLSQIQTGNGEVVITNDGATILKHMAVLHPAARMVSVPVLQ